MKHDAFNRAMEILDPLEEDPQGQTMSRAGAEIAVQDMAFNYAESMDRMKQGPRPKDVHEELLKIADMASALEKALVNASDMTRQAAWEKAVKVNQAEPNPHFTEMMPIYAFGGSGFPWMIKLHQLKQIFRLAAADPRLIDNGGRYLRAESRWEGTPNHWLVRQCRALLGACGKSCGGSTEGPLVNLLSAIAGKDDSKQTTFNNDIQEVLKVGKNDLHHKRRIAMYILCDLQRRRLVGDGDLQEANRVNMNIREQMVKEAGGDVEEWRHRWNIDK